MNKFYDSKDADTVGTTTKLIKVSCCEEPPATIFVIIGKDNRELNGEQGGIDISVESYARMACLPKDLQDKIRDYMKENVNNK